jgi:hypothetical protein
VDGLLAEGTGGAGNQRMNLYVVTITFCVVVNLYW